MAVNDYEIGFVVEIDERGNKSHESVTESCLESQIKKKLELNRIKIRSNIFDLETESLNEISGSRNLVEETGWGQPGLAEMEFFTISKLLHYLPTNIYDKIDRVTKSFIWDDTGRNRNWNRVKWSIVTCLKKFGGLAIREARLSNISLLWKLVWKFLYNPQKLWVRVFSQEYIKGDDIWNIKYSIQHHTNCHIVKWTPPQDGCVKLNIDGSCGTSGDIVSSGLLLDNKGDWIVDFSSNKG
ncbi:hypothetical protein MTR_0007s0410 [Medicago truncatula]|uniref:Uncharacterized protein n=1 Tax=Medicago truncatula TaxID=3880 RepID=A0A072TVN1_MEDTR|nr:hypothetical protein MTR_0007s0410 [Medicago truncatula]